MKFQYVKFRGDMYITKYIILYNTILLFWRAKGEIKLLKNIITFREFFIENPNIKYYYERYGNKNENIVYNLVTNEEPKFSKLTREQFKELFNKEKFHKSFEDKLL